MAQLRLHKVTTVNLCFQNKYDFHTSSSISLTHHIFADILDCWKISILSSCVVVFLCLWGLTQRVMNVFTPDVRAFWSIKQKTDCEVDGFKQRRAFMRMLVVFRMLIIVGQALLFCFKL